MAGGVPWVLRDISLALDIGEIVEIVELSGAERTGRQVDAVRILGGAASPSAGRRTARARVAVGYDPESLTPPAFSSPAQHSRTGITAGGSLMNGAGFHRLPARARRLG